MLAKNGLDNGVHFKDKTFIWYDNAYVLSLKFDEEKVEIVIKKIPKAGGEVR